MLHCINNLSFHMECFINLFLGGRIHMNKKSLRQIASGILCFIMVFTLAFSSSKVLAANNYDVNGPVIKGVTF